jgi:hypothetical protein
MTVVYQDESVGVERARLAHRPPAPDLAALTAAVVARAGYGELDGTAAELLAAFTSGDIVRVYERAAWLVGSTTARGVPLESVVAVVDALPRDDVMFTTRLAASLRVENLVGFQVDAGWQIGDVVVPNAYRYWFEDLLRAFFVQVAANGDIMSARRLADVEVAKRIDDWDICDRTAQSVAAALDWVAVDLTDMSPTVVVHPVRSYQRDQEALYARYVPGLLTRVGPYLRGASRMVSVMPRCVVTTKVGREAGPSELSDTPDTLSLAGALWDPQGYGALQDPHAALDAARQVLCSPAG